MNTVKDILIIVFYLLFIPGALFWLKKNYEESKTAKLQSKFWENMINRQPGCNISFNLYTSTQKEDDK